MKKILTNKKGFTLIELLAVIVVLAIIMVIATQQINGTIKKNRVDSFLSTYKVVMETTKTCAVQQISGADCVATVDYSTNDYTLTIAADSDYKNYTIELAATDGGEFKGISIKDYYKTNADIAKKLGTNTTKLKEITANPVKSLKATYNVG